MLLQHEASPPIYTPTKENPFSSLTGYYAPHLFIYFLRVLEVFLAGAAPCNQMRSRQCSSLKERRRSGFDLLQNQLIVVSCRATCVSETAGMVPSAGGCPPAGVNGSGVVGRNCRERRKNGIKNFPAWLSQTNARSKNGGRSLCDIQIGRETVLAHAGARVSRSPRLASCLVSAPNQRQRSAFDLFTARNCYSPH